MYNFRSIKAGYNVAIDIIYPDKRKSSYKSCICLSAQYVHKTGDYLFRLDQEKQVLLNDKSPSQLVDCMMKRLGNSLYPAILRVSSSGKIKNIENFDQIKDRWQNESDNILNEMPSCSIKQYLNLARKNLKDEKSFLQAFSRNTFILLYFNDKTKKEFIFPVYNLTGAGSIFYIQYKEKQADEHTVSYDWEDGESGDYCQLIYKYSSLGDVILIKSVLSIKDIFSKEEYRKEIIIELEQDNYEIKKRKGSFVFF
jgi:hypothetical protein